MNERISVLNRTGYEKKWQNILDPDSTQMTVWRTQITRRKPMATNTH